MGVFFSIYSRRYSGMNNPCSLINPISSTSFLKSSLFNNNILLLPIKYKSFYDYKYLEDYLTSEKEYWNLFVTNNYFLSSEIKNKIMTDLTPDYINEINKKEGFDKNKTFNY